MSIDRLFFTILQFFSIILILKSRHVIAEKVDINDIHEVIEDKGNYTEIFLCTEVQDI